MIEIEQRGYLTVDFKNWLEGNAEKVDEYEQINVFCESDQDSVAGFVDKKYTMSVVLTKRKGVVTGEAKMKKGDIGADSRQEYRFDFDPDDIDSLLGILETLGITGYCPRYYQRTDYKYRGFDISLKENGLLADHFEIELGVGDELKVEEGKEAMNDFILERGLQILAKDEYESILQKIYKDNPPVPWEEIDLSRFR
ncbi:MAG: hypothetical protein WC570_03835 [Patescibacteria group bacterium]